MRTYDGYKIFSDRNVNTGQLDLRYVQLTGNSSTAIFNNGLTVSGTFISNASGVFLNGINVSGDFFLNGQRFIIPSIGSTYDPESDSENATEE
jgi:hypothetical protein